MALLNHILGLLLAGVIMMSWGYSCAFLLWMFLDYWLWDKE